MTRHFVPALAAVLGLGGAALAPDQPLKINDKQYFEKRGLNVLVFTNEYNPYGVPIGTGGWAGNAQVIGWATTNYYLHQAYPDLVGTDLVTRGLDYLFGAHPAHNLSSRACWC